MTQGNSRINGFTPTEAVDSFNTICMNLSAVRSWVYSKLHPGSIQCPACGSPIQTERGKFTFRSGGRVCCHSCKKFFTNRTNTILHGSQLEFEQVYLIAVLSKFADRISADRIAARREISRIVGLHPDSIRNWEKIFAALEAPLV